MKKRCQEKSEGSIIVCQGVLQTGMDEYGHGKSQKDRHFPGMGKARMQSLLGREDQSKVKVSYIKKPNK